MVILKSVYFHLDKEFVRSGEIGVILELEPVVINSAGDVVYDYIVRIGDRILFFYEEEMKHYPEKR